MSWEVQAIMPTMNVWANDYSHLIPFTVVDTNHLKTLTKSTDLPRHFQVRKVSDLTGKRAKRGGRSSSAIAFAIKCYPTPLPINCKKKTN